MYLDKILGLLGTGALVLTGTKGKENVVEIWDHPVKPPHIFTLDEGVIVSAAVIDSFGDSLLFPTKKEETFNILRENSVKYQITLPGRPVALKGDTVIFIRYSNGMHTIFSTCCRTHPVVSLPLPPSKICFSPYGHLVVTRQVVRRPFIKVSQIFTHEFGIWKLSKTILGEITNWDWDCIYQGHVQIEGLSTGICGAAPSFSPEIINLKYGEFAANLLHDCPSYAIPILRDHKVELTNFYKGSQSLMAVACQKGFIFASSLIDPPRIYALNSLNEEGSQVELISWDLEIDGKIRTIPGLSLGKKGKIVIFLGGGPGARIMNEFSPVVSKIASAGYTIWIPGVSGTAGISREHYSRIYTNWGKADAEELISIIRLAKKQAEEVHIIGHSYGGFLALLAAESGFPDSVIAIGPFVSPQDLWLHVPTARKILMQWGYTRENMKASRSVSAEKIIEAGVPIQFITMKDDWSTPMTPGLIQCISKIVDDSTFSKHNEICGTHRLVTEHEISLIIELIEEFLG